MSFWERTKVNNFFKLFKSSIFIRLTWNLKNICKSRHLIQPTIIFEVNIGQKVNMGQKVNIGQISKIANFYVIDLKFEEDLHIRSLNSTTNYFWGQQRPKAGQISKFVNFHPIDLIFEKELHISSLNSTTNYF